MDRNQKVTRLLELGPEDTRRLALDEIDRAARAGAGGGFDTQHGFGSAEHRLARERVEKTYDAARRSLEAMSDSQLDEALAVHEPPAE